MPILTICRGVSGSGKSTWASERAACQPDTVVSERDLIRLALFGTESMADEDRVTNMQDADIRYNLSLGRNVIVADTNIEQRYVDRFVSIGYQASAVVNVKVFNIDLETALKRNEQRAFLGGRHVPEHVIVRQWERLNKTKEY